MKRYFLTSPDGQQEVEMLEGFEEERDRLLARGWTSVEVDQPAEVKVSKLKGGKLVPVELNDLTDEDSETIIDKPQAGSIADFLRGDKK